MREIKFRGKDMSGCWVYGLLTKKKIRNSGEIRYAIATGDCSLSNTIPVIEKSVGEFTGCYDSKGVEIYDGDILATPDKECVVVYREAGEWLIGDPEIVEKAGIYDNALDFRAAGKYTVVGNIFEDKSNERN